MMEKSQVVAAVALAGLLLPAVVLGVRAAESGGKNGSAVTTSSHSEAVLALVPQLIKSRPFNKEEVARLTGVALQKDATTSNPFFQTYRGRASGMITAVELRQPAQPQPGHDGMLLLDVSARACVKQAAVIARYGSKAEPLPPSPHGPQDALLYLVYTQDFGELRFGFSPSGERCLGAIVLDATGKR